MASESECKTRLANPFLSILFSVYINAKVASQRMMVSMMTYIFLFVTNLQLMVRLVVKEWQFTDGSHSSNNFRVSPQQSLYGSSNFASGTGRKINITVVEGKDLIANKSGRCDPYVKLQYGKVGLFVFFITWNLQYSKFVIEHIVSTIF